jgi:tRNA threonylcarbamoyl adenosine modification protein (Sua5/YciO/YrdC/YwlC family)
MSPPLIIDVNALDDPRDAIHRAVQGIAEGRIVILPTETSYCFAASALNPVVVKKVSELVSAQEAAVLALKSSSEALDYCPELSTLANRLTRRCWPGPLHLRMHYCLKHSLLSRIPPAVRELAFPENSVQLTVSVNGIVNSVLRLHPGPILLWPATLNGGAQPVVAGEVLQNFGNQIDLVIDEGRCRFGQPASVVEVEGERLQLIHAGVISEKALSRFSGYMITVVCTGNTCRSPMGEMLLKKRIAERLECTVDELEQRGVTIVSAGIAAMSGGMAAENAVEVMREHGLDLTTHESQPLSDRMVRYSDLLLTMTRGHREAILAQWPEAKDRTFTIARERGDVADPIGGPLELYKRCAHQIDALVQDWVSELPLPNKPPESDTSSAGESYT